MLKKYSKIVLGGFITLILVIAATVAITFFLSRPAAPAAPAATAAPQPTAPTSAPVPTTPVVPTAAPATERWIGLGRQILELPVRLPVEDGGATLIWSGRFIATFQGGKTAKCEEAVRQECVLVVIGRVQSAGNDNNTFVTLPIGSFTVPYASYNWLENRDGSTTPNEIKVLNAFKENIKYSLKNNCGSGCDQVVVMFVDAEGLLLSNEVYKK